MNLLDQNAPQIIKLHEEATKHAKLSVQAALRCGVLLAQAREQCAHGEWESYCVKTLGMSPVTAWRYQKLAAGFKERQLVEGAKLCDLYREFGLLPPNLGEGNRNPARSRELREADQLAFHFVIFEDAFKEVDRYSAKTGHTNPFESLDSDTLGQTREQLVKALALVDAALAAN